MLFLCCRKLQMKENHHYLFQNRKNIKDEIEISCLAAPSGAQPATSVYTVLVAPIIITTTTFSSYDNAKKV